MESVVVEDVAFTTVEAIFVLVDGSGLEKEIFGPSSVGEDVTFVPVEVIFVLVDGTGLEKEILGPSSVGERENRVAVANTPMSQYPNPR